MEIPARITDGAAVYGSLKRGGFSSASCHEGNSTTKKSGEFRRRNDFLAPSDKTFSMPISTEGDLISLGKVVDVGNFISAYCSGACFVVSPAALNSS